MLAQSKRAAINRANAQKSTGPRTEAGKARSARNAVSHGLRSGNFVLAHEDADEFHQILDHYHHRFCTATDLDAQFLVEQLVGAQWRLRRVQRLQTLYMDVIILGYSNEPTPDERILQGMEARSKDVLDTLHRYELQFDRVAWRIRKQLNSQQEQERTFDRRIAPIDRFGPPPPIEVMMAQQRQRKQRETELAANEPKHPVLDEYVTQIPTERLELLIEELQQLEQTNPFPEAEATEFQLGMLRRGPEHCAMILARLIKELDTRTKPRAAAA
jgi:hypothetical protein